MTRLLHPWFSLGFVVVFALQILNWLRPMTWTSDDRRWMKHLKAYVTNAEALEPEYVGFFNAGQKLYFWAIVGERARLPRVAASRCGSRATFGRLAVAIELRAARRRRARHAGRLHRSHLRRHGRSSRARSRSMTRGTVEKRWAWTHHPAWYRAVTGRDPRADYERAVQRQTETLKRA